MGRKSTGRHIRKIGGGFKEEDARLVIRVLFTEYVRNGLIVSWSEKRREEELKKKK